MINNIEKYIAFYKNICYNPLCMYKTAFTAYYSKANYLEENFYD